MFRTIAPRLQFDDQAVMKSPLRFVPMFHNNLKVLVSDSSHVLVIVDTFIVSPSTLI